MREADVLIRFVVSPKSPPGQRGAALAGVVRDHQRRTAYPGPGPERGLAQPRMAHHADALRVDSRVGFQVVQSPAQPPGPGADGAPFVGIGPRLAGSVEQRVNAVLEPVVEVGVDVSIIGGGDGVTPVEDQLQGPSRRGAASDTTDRFVVAVHSSRHRNGRVRLNRVIPPEVQPDERRMRPGPVIGHVEQKVHPRPIFLSRKMHDDLLPGGLAANGILHDWSRLEPQPLRTARRPPIHMILEELQNLGPSPTIPRFGISHGRAIGHYQRVGQGVGADLRLVIVGRCGGLRPNRQGRSGDNGHEERERPKHRGESPSKHGSRACSNHTASQNGPQSRLA